MDGNLSIAICDMFVGERSEASLHGKSNGKLCVTVHGRYVVVICRTFTTQRVHVRGIYIVFPAVCSDSGEYMNDFMDSIGYGLLGDFVHMNHGNA